MSKVVRLVTKSECERARLIREARALYESVFPLSGSYDEQFHEVAADRAAAAQAPTEPRSLTT
jgi:hypothetical protein